ncbi:MAG: hypothetical protein JJT99_00580 [Rhodobacteraceae bacterium]|nr:hypothetical protein [Paracoccaceae bacterium]
MSGGQGKALQDFAPFTPAEDALVKWLQAGNRKVFRVSNSVPVSATEEVTLRASFIRFLALGGCDACRLPETGLRVWGAYILGDDDNSGGTKGLDFEGATLPHDLALVFCHIPDPIILRSAKLKNLFLHSSDVKAAITADRLQVEGGVFLREAKIAGEVQLLGARLGGELSCTGAELQAKGNALRCDGMQAEGSVFLSNAKIAGEVRLLGARLGGDLSCTGAELQAKSKALNCDGAKITGTFFLREGAKVSGCIDLTGASLGAINDDPACWPPELILKRCRFGAFLGRSPIDAETRKTWLALQKPQDYGQDFWPDPYEHCAKVLREMGHGAEATKILIEKERLQREARRHRLRRAYLFEDYYWFAFWDRILGATVAYGRRPLLAAAWLLVPYLLGVWIFGTAFARDEVKPNLPQIQRSAEWVLCGVDATETVRLVGDNEATSGLRQKGQGRLECFHTTPEGRGHPQFNPYIYSADSLLPILSLEMQSYWIPDDSQPFGKFARFYLWLHIIAGWALTLLAVAGFSGLIKTDNIK